MWQFTTKYENNELTIADWKIDDVNIPEFKDVIIRCDGKSENMHASIFSGETYITLDEFKVLILHRF